MSTLVVGCFIMALNPLILAYAKLGDEGTGFAITGNTREEIAASLRAAFEQMKPKVKENMLLSEALDNLQKIKQEYSEIASKYEDLYYGGDVLVSFGSKMWLEEYEYSVQKRPHECVALGIVSEEQLYTDYAKCSLLISKAEELFKTYKMDQFLLEGSALYWIGALPEPYLSTY